jgi:glutamate carboxypeptidase
MSDAANDPGAELPEPALREARRVRDCIGDGLDELLADLERWVSIDSRADALDLLGGLARDIGSRLELLGFTSELVPIEERGPYVHATMTGTGHARVALLCHHDTVFDRGTAAARPFSRDANRAYGPGVADMKGGLALAAHVGHCLSKSPWSFGHLELVSASDEESRPHALRTIERLEGFDAVLCFECGRVDGSVVSARKGGRWFRVCARGRAAHAGVAPDEGRNAALAICHEALRLEALDAARAGMTLQITGLLGGIGLNTVPEEAALTADLRAVRAEDLEWAMQQVEAFGNYPGIELTLEDLGGPPPFECKPHVLRLAETAVALGKDLGHDFDHVSTGGVSDGSWTAWHGLPTLDGLGPVGGLDHTAAEYIELATIPARAGVVAGVIAAVELGLLA